MSAIALTSVFIKSLLGEKDQFENLRTEAPAARYDFGSFFSGRENPEWY
jgi:hypothetical protein